MADRIQFRRDISSSWAISNPILAQGELGYETDTNQFKIGDGSTAWSGLSYFSGGGGSGSSSGALNFTAIYPKRNVYNPKADPPTGYVKEAEYKGFCTSICFTLNIPKATIVQSKEDIYIALGRYKRNRSKKTKKEANLRFKRQNDRRFQTNKKLYCWRADINEEGEGSNPTEYSYFYTEDNYNDNVSALINADPTVYVYRTIDGEQDYSISNWATCLNAVYNTGYYGVTNFSDDGPIYRCPERDINEIVVTKHTNTYLKRVHGRKYSKDGNIYFLWSKDWEEASEDVYGYLVDGELKPNEIPDSIFDLEIFTTVEDLTDYTFVEERQDLLWYAMRDEIIVDEETSETEPLNEKEMLYMFNDDIFGVYRNSDKYNTYWFNRYWWDYPIMPVRLSQCEVLITISLPEEEGEDVGYKQGSWVKLNELLNDEYGIQQWNQMDNIVFRLPYDTYYLWMRFTGWQKYCYYMGYDGESEYAFYRKNTLPSAREMDSWKRFGSKLEYETSHQITEYIQFEVVKVNDIIHNNKSDSVAIRKRLSLANRFSTFL